MTQRPGLASGHFFSHRWHGQVPVRLLFWRDMLVMGTAINLLATFGALMLAATLAYQRGDVSNRRAASRVGHGFPRSTHRDRFLFSMRQSHSSPRILPGLRRADRAPSRKRGP